MSQSLTTVSSNASVGALWYGSGGKNVSVQGNVQSFGQTLVSMLGNGGSSQEGQLSAQLGILAGLTDTVDGQAFEGEGHDLNALLEGLLQQLDQLDDALVDNPELLAVLQGWLQNVNLFLQNQISGQAADSNSEMEGSLPLLAEHPHTIRFAVQDALLQLAASSGMDAAAIEAMNPNQAKALMESLQQLMAAAQAGRENKPKDGTISGQAVTAQGNAASENASVLNRVVQNQETKSSEVQQTEIVVVPKHESTAARTSSMASAYNNITEDAATTDSEGNSVDHDFSLQSGNITTAGQLALRDQGAQPLKTAAPQVPVEQFGQEISRFLVNKLEIVKAGGLSEARISLYPEHLGHVDVKITLQNGQLVAQFMTEHAFAKESLEAQMAQLRLSLQSQGLQVNKLEVTQNTALSSHMYQDGRQSGNGTNQQQNGKRRDILRDEELLAINDLNDEWNEWISDVRAREASLGSSFVARA